MDLELISTRDAYLLTHINSNRRMNAGANKSVRESFIVTHHKAIKFGNTYFLERPILIG